MTVRIWFIKICIDGNYVYDYYTDQKKVNFSVSAYNVNGEFIELLPEQLNIQVITSRQTKIIDGFSCEVNDIQSLLKVGLKNSLNIQDEIRILKISNRKKKAVQLIENFDFTLLKADDYFIRLINKGWKVHDKCVDTFVRSKIENK